MRAGEGYNPENFKNSEHSNPSEKPEGFSFAGKVALAYTGDLKSPGLLDSCGFESRCPHHERLAKCSNAAVRKTVNHWLKSNTALQFFDNPMR